MIPTSFEYESPDTVEDAVRLLAEGGDDVKVLAGGQSLIPVLKMRLAGPELIVDLGRIDGLRGIREDGDDLVIGAMTPHHEVAASVLVREHAALLAEATSTVADPQVRHRGTLGGALVHADPAGDLPAPALALEASFEIAGPGGARTVPASEFFVDLFTTAVGEDEILTAVRIPKRTGWGAAYEKFVRVSQQWSIVAVAATVRLEGGTIAEARLGLTNMGSTPVRPKAVEQALIGVSPVAEAVEAAVSGVADGTTPPDDLNGSPDYRRHLARVLTRRAVVRAAGA
ncbi:xanthine dehydrogenase family protein subunit M [Mumia sp. ZJ1417]|uniref:FAD binding domain-containing protein n=1 Tax=Mumia sp. ZJ1417 TaxID=2708082 RepID=UPI0014203974|nr:xanthine dehydrogenase family protein subunit M [Mumia sp. ZJ1417]QMW67024.1 xanthine dehydrogenase family protein subunit M [Mumia sp. ZJ1417]